MSQRVRIVIGILVSAFFLAWTYSLVQGSFSEALVALARANYLYLVPGLVAYFLGVWIRAIRWHFLLRPIKRIPVRRLFPVVVIGYMANDVLPARLGEVVRAYVLGEQEDVPKMTSLATILVERLFDGIAMLIFVAVVAALVPLNDQVAGIFRFGAILFLVALIVLFAVGSSRERAVRLVQSVERRLPPSVQGKAVTIADRFLQGLNALQNGRLSAAILGLSLAAWLCEATMYLTIALGFGLNLGFPAFMLTTAVANLGAMVPALPGYVGTFDALALLVLKLFRAEPGLITAYVVVLHLALLVPVTLLGFFFLWRANLSLRNLGQRATEPTSGVPS